MLKCDRCGWSFDSVRLAREGSCPRCRLRDGVAAPLAPEPDQRQALSFFDLISDATKRVKPGKEVSEAREA
jgi:hypothetical protein